MGFTDKYTTESEKTKEENKDKKVISDDAFAIGTLLNDLVLEMKKGRITRG